MDRLPSRVVSILAVVVVVLGAATGSQAAQYGWGFTYQGELNLNGSPVNGTANLEFKLFTAPAAGAQVGSTVTAPNYAVTDGKFTIELDFTNNGLIPGVIDGTERYVQVAVNGTVLTPRQRLSATPHATMAKWLNVPVHQLTISPSAINMISNAQVPQVRVIRAETQSNEINAIALIGEANNTNNNENVGVYGSSNSGNGFGVFGACTATGGNNSAVYGSNISTSGAGVFGHNASATGVTKGVYGKVDSPDGWAGYFEGRGFFSQPVGIRTIGALTANLDIDGSYPGTGLTFNANDRLFVNSLTDFVGVNRSTRVSSTEFFGVRAPVAGTSYGGMYVDTESTTGKPFYGYATNGVAEGWSYFDAATDLWHLYLSGNRITVDKTSGNTGIKRAPAANDFEVEGTASKTTAGSWLANSDARIKTDVQTIGGALDKLDDVRLVSFHYTDDYRAAHPDIEDRAYLNVIAQEFQQVFPEHVKSSGEKLPDGSEILQVDTYPLTIYAAAAVQELHGLVRGRDEKIAAQDAELAELRGRLAQLEAVVTAVAAQLPANPPVAQTAAAR